MAVDSISGTGFSREGGIDVEDAKASSRLKPVPLGTLPVQNQVAANTFASASICSCRSAWFSFAPAFSDDHCG